MDDTIEKLREENLFLKKEINRLQQADQARQKAESLLRETEDRFRALADTAPVMIWMSDSDALCTFLNQSWLQFTGRTMEQETGYGWAEAIHPEDTASCLTNYQTYFRDRKPFHLEYRLRRSDGVYRWLFDTGIPRFHPDGSFAGYIGSCIDITEQKETQEKLETLNRSLHLAIEETHHRVKNNLQAVSAILEMQIQEASDMVPIEVFTESLLQIKTIALVHDVLSLNHPIGKVSAEQVVTRLISLLKEGLWIHDGQIALEIEPILLPTGMATALALSINELVSNALKHGLRVERSSDRGPDQSTAVLIRLYRQEGLCCLEIEDYGPGFPAQFDFQRDAHTGLMLVKSLVENDLSGNIEFENVTGQRGGAKITVCFPNGAEASPL